MKLDKETFEKWQEWCKKVKIDLNMLLLYKQIQDHLFEIVPANAKHIDANNGALFFEFVRDCYGCYVTVGIRRLAKRSSDKNNITLIRLLEQIRDCADQFTFDFYLKMYPINGPKLQRRKFDNFSDDGIVISKVQIECDIKELESISKKVSDFVDRRIAHNDKKATQSITFDDMSKSLELLNIIACKYFSLITSSGYLTLKPEIQYNWKDIFKVPIDI